jgi:hypothetical protein
MKPYRAISTDDHLMEAADGYTSRMSARGDKIWEYIERSLADCTEEERRMILVDTPRRLYHLPEGY